MLKFFNLKIGTRLDMGHELNKIKEQTLGKSLDQISIKFIIPCNKN